MRRRRSVTALPLATLLALAAAGASPVRAAGIVAFHTPSGNIYCAYAPSSEGYAPSIRCDIRTKLWRPPRKPASCPVDYGQGLSLTAVPKPGQKGAGRASVVCAGDTVLGLGGPVLAYGRRFARVAGRLQAVGACVVAGDAHTRGIPVSDSAACTDAGL